MSAPFPVLSPGITEILTVSRTTRYQPILTDPKDRIVWRGGSFKTAEEASAEAKRRLQEFLKMLPQVGVLA